MEFVYNLEFYDIFWKLCELCFVLSEAINILRNLQQQKIGNPPPPQNFASFMYIHIAPSIDHSLLNLNLSFKMVLRKIELVFW